MTLLARAAAAALVAFAAATSAGCRDEQRAAPQPPRLPATSPHDEGVAVGDGSLVTSGVGPSCVSCHADVADRYRSSGMSDALTLPSGAGSIEASLVGKACVDPATGITIRFEAKDGRYVQRIVYVDAAGVERASHEYPVDLVVGSGHATRTYFEVREGRFIELPATWYRETGALALSPGAFFRNAAGARVEHRCIECHVGDVTPHPSGATGHFKGAVSLGITCRRCHGDGAEHVRTGKRGGGIVNPSDLDLARQDEVCAQCHLSAAVAVAKPGTSLARDYRPGEPLGAFLGVYSDAAPKGDAPGTEIAGHGTRLRLSRCATESGEDGRPALTCTTCHDPHEGHRLPAAERQLDRGCAVCHTQASCTLPVAERGEKTCSSCHMAVYPSSDIAHTKTTDHFIRARPPASAGFAHRPTDGFIGVLAAEDRALRSLLDPENALPGADLLRAIAYRDGIEVAQWVLLKEAPGYARRLTEAAERLVREAPEDADAALLLASARFRSGRAEEAAALFAEHERRFGRRPHVRLARAVAERSLRRTADAAVSARMAVEDDPYDESAGRVLAEALVELRRGPDAVAVLADLRARLGPDILRAEQMIGAARAAGDVPRVVEAAFDRLMFRPRDAIVLADAANILAFEKGDAEVARVLFRDALARDAECVSALVGLARVESAAGAAAAARGFAERAERLQPGIPEVTAILRGAR
jgi:tetratricopeptide (TPR) repeat protein